MLLSKSDYILFLKHPAWLWLKKHRSTNLPEVDDNLQVVFDRGHQFEKFAEKFYPGGITIGFDEENFNETYKTMPLRTKKAIEDGATTIFQGRFEAGNITCITDIVRFIDKNTIDLYEIKSSTKTKILHEHDLAFQRIVLERCGYTVRNVLELRANNTYVRHGEINVSELIATDDVTEATLKLHDDTEKHIKNAIDVMESSTRPNISPAFMKFDDKKQWIGIYKELVNPPAGSIYDLCGINAKLVEYFEDMNIQFIRDIPDSMKLRPQQVRQIKAVKEDKVYTDRSRIKSFLSQLEYPLYFLDYETLSCLVPEYDGTRPYQQVPFQYSLHIIDSPQGNVRVAGYLHKDNTLPIEPLSKSLAEHIGPKGSILVWHESFEKGRNIEMGDLLPEFHKFYHSVNSRIIDLKIPFSEGWYVHKDFLGHASIKNVLPVLIPKLAYTDLDIQEGMTAQRLWMETVLNGKDPDKREEILNNLVKYCTLDTLAMVEIYKHLETILL